MINRNSVKNNIHFIGIGGIGMAGIAIILANQGYKISGSDIVSNEMINHLISLGVTIFLKHHPSNIKNAHLIVVSTAIPDDNPELVASYKARIPVIQRAQMLAELMRFRYGIAITGTHGKTTTTAMISSIFIEAGLDPTFINGGLIKTLRINAQLGTSKYLIIEADESDASFLKLRPIVAVVTNIDIEHLDTYHGKIDNLKKAFLNFLHNLPFYGSAIICLDNHIIYDLLPHIKRKVITYGFNKNADVCITNYNQHGMKVSLTLVRKSQSSMSIILNVPGYHNALNAAAAVAVSMQQGISDNIIFHALKNYQGTKRRFDFLGEFYFEPINGKAGTVFLVDDYGHHPTEIYATIKTARHTGMSKRIVMIFQPHRYTRTRDLYDDFVNVLSQVDIVLLLNIYSAGEKPILGINSHTLCHTLRIKGKRSTLVVEEEQVIHKLAQILSNKDFLIIQGAGNLEPIINTIISKLKPVSMKYYESN
ncbi:MAG: UDP-N-acetylmuramate--L-alanine ligase [Candidatus Dasytiphilus stammeri]